MHTSPPSPHPTIKEHAAKLDYLDFSKCAAVQRLASNCVKEIAKSNCCPEVMPPAWSYVCNGSCDCGDYSQYRALRKPDVKKRCTEFCPNALRNGVPPHPRPP